MSKALAWIRKSKGTDDDIGLEEQRERVHALADELADEKDVLDLGIQTGFSTMGRESDAEQLLDEREDVDRAIERLESGVYDYLVAFDANRISRDDYFSVIEYAATQGGCEFVYVADVTEDDLTHDIKRRIDRETKQREIQKSKAAIRRRMEKGHDHGAPKHGMTYNSDSTRQVPGEDFEDVVRVFKLREAGETLEAIAEETGISVSTVHRITDRREWYRERADGRL
jgi:DNA invertase Pin-like site-specific DNA recombinase